MFFIRHAFLAATVGTALVAAWPVVAASLYSITDLGTFGGIKDGISTGASGINASGEVTGYSVTASGDQHAFLYNGSTLLDLGTLGGSFSAGVGINDRGEVTGQSSVNNSLNGNRFHAFIYNGSTMFDLGSLAPTDTSGGDGINNRGEVTGQADLGRGEHAFLYDGSTLHDLGTLGAPIGSIGRGINDSGEVTGDANPPLGAAHAFLYNGSTLLDLGTLGGNQSSGNEINANGEVTGFSSTTVSPLSPIHAFLYNGSAMLDLGTLGGAFSDGLGINDSGEVTGDSASHAFLYDAGTMFDLNNLIDPSSPLFGDIVLGSGVGINDNGQIAANGCYTAGSLSGQCRAFLLSPETAAPVPEPGTLLLLGSTLVGFSAIFVATKLISTRS